MLPKARVFAVNMMGLFFPELGLEQARFLRLTTCQTIVGDHMSEFGARMILLEWLFFDYAVQILRGHLQHTVCPMFSVLRQKLSRFYEWRTS